MSEIYMHGKCNNHCINCVGYFSNPECISFNDLKKTETDLLELGIIQVSGGEPTLHKDFFQVMGYLNSLKKEVFLLTNSRAFSNNHFFMTFDKLELNRIKLRVASAIYGPDNRTHDSISRAPGSFDETIEGIKNLIQSRYTVELRVIITALNSSYLKEIAEFISKELKGVERVIFISPKLTGKAYKNKRIIIEPYAESVKKLIPAIDILEKANFDVRLFHYPHCVLPEKYRKLSSGRTADKDELYFNKECRKCRYYKNCSGIWKSYYDIAGDNEIKTEKMR